MLTKSSFNIATTNGWETVQGRSSAQFGVHRIDRAAWNITHLRSGCRIASAATYAQAAAIAQALEDLPVNWSDLNQVHRSRDIIEDAIQSAKEPAHA